MGGFLRDFYLGKEGLFDFDFCVKGDTLSLVEGFSRLVGARHIVLDEKNQSYRIVLKKAQRLYTYDFTILRAKTLEEDLSLRDFSINTLAIDLSDKDFRVRDYFGASKDLKKKRLRAIKKEVFSADPLRILRGFSFMANYGFTMEKETQRAMYKYRGLLKNVSPERIQEELFKILSAGSSYPAFKLMSKFKIIDEVIPQIKITRKVKQGSYHHLDVWGHSLETLRVFERLFQNKLSKNKDFLEYLNEELAQGKKRLEVIKLACILHDLGKPIAKRRKKRKTIFYGHERIGAELIEGIALNLRLAVRIKEVLKRLVFWHLRPGYLAEQSKPSPRAIYRFFRDTLEEGPGVIFLSLADWRATRGPLTDSRRRVKYERIMLKLVGDYFREKKKKPLPKIVDGYQVMERFKLKPSPLVGEILKRIKEEQALGRVKTKKEAFLLAQRIVSKNLKLKKGEG